MTYSVSLIFGVWLAFFICLSRGSVVDIVSPSGTCIRIDGDVVNVRDAPCGNVIGTANAGQFYTAGGGNQWCSLSGADYDFHEVDFNGQSGWMAGEFLTLDRTSNCQTVTPPDSEWRGMWIATVYNIDWPSSPSISSSEQQQELIEYLDMAVELNFNAVVFQVRPVGDALYSSTIEPWSKYLTGTQGTPPDPFYDPLTFLCDEAHARNIEVHVWLNPYRANMAPNTDGLQPNHMAMEYPQYAYPYGSYLWMDPGAQVIIDRLIAVVDDIIRRFDVDGIHFDDYFYPYPVDGVDFPDSATYNDYISSGGTLALDDWRRDNVNRMVELVWSNINELNTELGKSVKFSISPFGIYRPGHAEGMPPPIAGLDPYTAMFADSKLWFGSALNRQLLKHVNNPLLINKKWKPEHNVKVEAGWMDFLIPQLYWNIEAPAQSYTTLLDWWCDVGSQSGVQIYAGNGLYRLDDGWPVAEFGVQVDVSRALRDVLSLGNCQYSAKYLRDDVSGVKAIFSGLYPNQASMPYVSKRK